VGAAKILLLYQGLPLILQVSFEETDLVFSDSKRAKNPEFSGFFVIRIFIFKQASKI